MDPYKRLNPNRPKLAPRSPLSDLLFGFFQGFLTPFRYRPIAPMIADEALATGTTRALLTLPVDTRAVGFGVVPQNSKP